MNVVFCQYATPLHIELHLICSTVCCILPCHVYLNRTCIIHVCASCHVYVTVVYHDVCFFPVVLLLNSSCFVAILRIRSSTFGSSTPVRILHGLTTIIAMLVVSMLSLYRATYHLFIKPPKLP